MDYEQAARYCEVYVAAKNDSPNHAYCLDLTLATDTRRCLDFIDKRV